MADGGITANSFRGELRQRILQAGGRRYSLRLETCYWETLATIAAQRHLRLNRLVAEIAAHADGTNLAARLRILCLEESRRMVVSRAFGAQRSSVLALIESAPAPALAADARGRIVATNPPFLDWIGVPPETLTDTPLFRHFRFHCRSGRGIDALWRELGNGWAAPETARMIHIAPGRVLAANARLVPMIAARGRPLCVVWIAK